MIPRRVDEGIYEVSPEMKVVKFNETIMNFTMAVPARIYANEYLMERIARDKSVDQITNVACLPGIRKQVIAMSDAHQGYGFCIGGVAATDVEGGAISPGGVGYDINCGVRLLRTPLKYAEVAPVLPELTEALFQAIPSGLGSRGKLKITNTDLDRVLDEGINWAIDNGYGFEKDRVNCEDNGFTQGADSSIVSAKAKARGIRQLGSLGSGNHFIEIQKVAEILDPVAAKIMGIEKDQVTVMIHTGSRAMGHQICTDSLQEIDHLMHREGIIAPDRELGYVISGTKEADRYLAQMRAAANFAWTNRHIIMHWARGAFNNVLNVKPEDMELVYGLAHNILKQEEHDLGDGKRGMVNVHRKGATRAFPPGHKDVPLNYREIGQPVLIPGSMGTSSYLCVGQQKAMDLSFASTAHGGGREMSRSKAKRKFFGKNIKQELNDRGISVRAASLKVLAEEAPLAYKNIDEVVGVSHNLGIVKKVARLVPIGVTKG
ncbi:tRNA-splicing ligase RtcB [Candidatus Lokiarchaeum ossiferum]|uniref:tRNA-splicing ligase RtcB n=1 Tax=Candidatus Lokiarchaeum ossiferum TaxID=2951803 RepID=A0ABY6HRP4_9ARCH|nr:tRNA-splicing ligase RtcB [Candidatus Lokiarchaeum sp. B-35]